MMKQRDIEKVARVLFTIMDSTDYDERINNLLIEHGSNGEAVNVPYDAVAAYVAGKPVVEAHRAEIEATIKLLCAIGNSLPSGTLTKVS